MGKSKFLATFVAAAIYGLDLFAANAKMPALNEPNLAGIRSSTVVYPLQYSSNEEVEAAIEKYKTSTPVIVYYGNNMEAIVEIDRYLSLKYGNFKTPVIVYAGRSSRTGSRLEFVYEYYHLKCKLGEDTFPRLHAKIDAFREFNKNYLDFTFAESRLALLRQIIQADLKLRDLIGGPIDRDPNTGKVRNLDQSIADGRREFTEKKVEINKKRERLNSITTECSASFTAIDETLP